MRLRTKVLAGTLATATLLVVGALFTLVVVLGYRRHPDASPLITSDLSRFNEARLRLPGVSDTAAFLDSVYFDQGSVGLKAYASIYRRDGAALTRVLRKRGGYYDSIADLEARVAKQEPAIRRAFGELERVYPKAVFPRVYFVVGGLGPGGQPGQRGVYIGADTYGAPEGRVIAPGSHLYHTSSLPQLVVHEVVHFNQFAASPITYSRQWTNLARAIKEGSADFLAERLTGAHISQRAHAYGLLHESELWARFEPDMHTGNTGDWFWTAPADSAAPPDLGYFIGYRIVQSWFAKHAHESGAMAKLMEIADYPRFLKESGYRP